MKALEIPQFLISDYRLVDYRVVDIDRLYVGLLPAQGNAVEYVSIYETPHYMFAQYVLHGVPARTMHGYRDYSHYRLRHPQSHSQDAFVELIKNMKEYGYDWQTWPILVFRRWRGGSLRGQWGVADGFHRLAVLATLGTQRVYVATLRHRRNVLLRILARFL